MKNLILVLGFSFLSVVAQAQTVISKKTVVLPVAISDSTVRLSARDYSQEVVKILIPELAAVTIMNHRNNGEGAPCMATYDAQLPSDIVKNNPQVENISFTIELLKYTNPTVDGGCSSVLYENITANIRGYTFEHSRSMDLPDRVSADCK